MLRALLVLALAALHLCSGLACAQSLREEVNAAIDRGVEHLITEQLIDGSWYEHQPGYRAGATALALYALLECDVPATHPAVLRGTHFLIAIEPTQTYEVSITLIAFLELRKQVAKGELATRLDQRIAKYLALLISFQQPNGGYGYPTPEIDLSNTQYAAMALRNAAQAGFEVPPKTWKGLAEYTISLQEDAVRGSVPRAGVRYRSDYAPSGSMTAAAVATLHICNEQQKRPIGNWSKRKDAALAWLADRFIVNDNPGQSGSWHYYYLYTVERVGSMLNVRTIGDHAWYEEGAAFLVGAQQVNGDWGGRTNTAFALLFLKRATAPSTGASDSGKSHSFGNDDALAPVSLRAFGENPLRIWISSFGDAELAEFGVDVPGEGRRIEVLRCEYWLESGPGVDTPRLLRQLESSDDPRFAFEQEFNGRGTYTVRAVVNVAATEEEGGSFQLDSAPLEIEVRVEDQTELVRIAAGLVRNQLRGIELRARCSSSMDGDHEPQHVADGIHAVGWMSALQDTDPFVSIAWNEYLKVSEIRVAHLQAPNAQNAVLPRHLRITLNGREELTLEMPNSRLELGRLELDHAEKVRSLRIDVIDTYEGPEGAIRPVGIGEVELRETAGD